MINFQSILLIQIVRMRSIQIIYSREPPAEALSNNFE